MRTTDNGIKLLDSMDYVSTAFYGNEGAFNINGAALDTHIADAGIHVTAALNQKLAGFEPYQQLWSGSWGSGSITVPGAENYRVFQFELEGTNCPLTVYRCGQWVLAGGGSVATDDRVLTSHIYATIANGNQFSLGSCYTMWHNFGSNHGARGEYSDKKISAIYGIV